MKVQLVFWLCSRVAHALCWLIMPLREGSHFQWLWRDGGATGSQNLQIQSYCPARTFSAFMRWCAQCSTTHLCGFIVLVLAERWVLVYWKYCGCEAGLNLRLEECGGGPRNGRCLSGTSVWDFETAGPCVQMRWVFAGWVWVMSVVVLLCFLGFRFHCRAMYRLNGTVMEPLVAVQTDPAEQLHRCY